VRADANGDLRVDIADPIWMLSYLFQSGQPSLCADATDANDDGRVDISDAIYTLSYLFQGGPSPRPPGAIEPGFDPTPDGLGCQ
jgi:hypothetical protein